MKIEIEGTWPRKSWRDCLKGDMESLGLACEDAQAMDHWRLKIKSKATNPDFRARWP